MIDLYTYGTINGRAVAITLEELQLPYKVHEIDLMQGAQRSTAFLAINPSGRIPVIIDQVNNQPITISQTGAILLYLAEKNGQLLGNNPAQRASIMSWLLFQLTDITTNVFNNFYLKSLIKEKQPAAAEALKQRAIGFYREFNKQLENNEYLCGESISLADLASYPVVSVLQEQLINQQHPHLSRWFRQLSLRECIQKGMQVPG